MIVLLALGALILPAMIWLGPAKWHVMHDPLMKRMHAYILEFLPYTRSYNLKFAQMVFANFGFLPLFLLAAPFLTGSRKTNLYEWALLWMAFLPALAYAILLQVQARWIGFLAGALLLQAMVAMAILARHRAAGGRASRLALAVMVVLAVQPILFVRGQVQGRAARREPRHLDNELVKSILQRQFAARLGALNTNGIFRLMCEPDMAARLYYHGGLPSVTSFYWENLDGLRAATEFFSTPDIEKARRILQERGITHVVIPRTAELAHVFHFFQHGFLSEKGARDSMAGRLLTQADQLPPWIRRDRELEKFLQPGYTFAGTPFFNTLNVFTVHPDRFHDGAPPPDREKEDGL